MSVLTCIGAIELELSAQGFRLLGVDEVGRGCIAGPVVTACASLDYSRVGDLEPKERALIRDSKTLTRSQRERALKIIQGVALEVHLGIATAREIELLGIAPATHVAMQRAISQCIHPFDLLLIDGNQTLKGHIGAQRAIVKGDQLCYAIAAASIVAKCHRDDFMNEQDQVFPGYGFKDHVGYGTKQHLDSLQKLGICELHRRNFAPISSMATVGE